MAAFQDFALLCDALAQTSSRLQMAEAAGAFLAAIPADEAAVTARFMIGIAAEQGNSRRIEVSGRALWKVAAELAGAADSGEEIFASATDFGEAIEMTMRMRRGAPEPSLSILEVDRTFREIAEIEGRRARARKLEALRNLLERSVPLEAKYIAKILIREMRHGMNEGVMIEAIARMANRPVAQVRRLNQIEGDVGRVVIALRDPNRAPARASSPISKAKPLKPMLASPAREVADAFAIFGRSFALEHKLDGARVQIHRSADGATQIFSRALNDITASLPEVVEAMSALGARSAILDAEVIAVDSDGHPMAFQEIMRRFGRTREVARMRGEQAIKLAIFDLIALDTELLIDRPYSERTELLAGVAAASGLETVGKIFAPDLASAERFFADAIAEGYEGVMAKQLDAPYTPGARGRGWLKIKHVRTLDLVIVAADWGYGRRHGWLSNYHLAARDTDGFAMIGKTFKGLNDEQFQEMTERLLALKIDEARGTVRVRPEIVVEVAYNDIQRSSTYPSAMALRFARIIRIRSDKTAGDADTIATVAAEFERQSLKPAARTSGLPRR